MSHLLGRTLRQAPAEAETASHKLLLRAGLVRQLAAGIYSYLPLGYRVVRKIERIMQEEMDAIGGQQVELPVLHPAELWKETGRWFDVGQEMVRLKDRADRDFVLGMTHEEVITDLARREVRSYRQLPFMAYQIQTKVRDEPRPRGGLVRLREFLMKDGYSFHADPQDLDAYYPLMYQAYLNIFSRSGLKVVPVEADPGMMGGTGSHEFVMLSPTGEDTFMLCQGCGYAANLERAEFVKPAPVLPPSDEPAELVATPGAKTIDDLVNLFGLPAGAMLKTVVYAEGERLVAAVIRGDLAVNEAKLARALHTAHFHLATDEELRAHGVYPGYVSPVGLEGVHILVDDSIREDTEYIAGANRPDAHLRHTRLGRDFQADEVADIAAAREGDPCPRCGGTLHAERGIEAGHTFKLGTKYSAAMGATYLGADGQERPIIMGCYGIGVDRLIASVVEQSHDERGIMWPKSIAPFQVQLVALGMDDAALAAYAENVYQELSAAGYEVLFDDRDDTPGVKFNDADLIGTPLRLTVSQRTMSAAQVELKPRTAKQFSLVPRGELVQRVAEALAAAP
ncbi:MAG: proline--tRNA ligase [Chloroflexi bacterium]|nr:proline--tRNA ligase [Chloroflexota bacterium]MCL5109068.1 proline--tRNA ligase [Chloroflexota bacterium]